MKHLFFWALLIPVFGWGQECEGVFKSTKDKFTDKERIATELIPAINGESNIKWGVSLHNQKGNERLHIIIVLGDNISMPCIDENDRMIFLLENGEKIIQKNGLSYNCDGGASAAFYIKGLGSKQFTKMLDRIQKSKIVAVRISTKTNNYDYDFTEDQAEDLAKAIACGLNLLNYK